MDVSTQSEGTHHAFTSSHTRVRIADIDHGDSRSIEGRFLEAEIVLVWPYSTLTQEAGFLLAEKDVLLRKTKGQVRTTFHNHCAREIAKLKAGVGDTLRTSLRNAQLVEEQDDISTPGKKAGFAISYQHTVNVEILREGGQVTTLNYEELPPAPGPVQNGTNSVLATPRDTRLKATVDSELSMLNSTPSFRTGSRLSSNSFPDSFVDPFVSEDGSVAGRGRKRTRFGRYSGAWRLIDNDEDDQETPLSPAPPSVHEQTGTETAVPTTEDTTVMTEDALTLHIPIESPSEAFETEKVEDIVIEAESPQQSLDETNKAETLPSSAHISLPLSSPERRIRIERPSFDSETMPTPRLQALASPELSIVSPLVARSQYFPRFDRPMSELDASSQKHDQTVFAASSPVLNDLVNAEELDMPDSSRTELSTINQDLEDPNSQAAFFPSSVLQAGEIDLDALQEQIEINNATPLPVDVLVEAVEEVLEDPDMYGPPIDKLPAEESHIIYPSLEDVVEQPMESPAILLQERYTHVEEPLSEVEFRQVTSDAPSVVPEAVANPLPSLLDNAVRELEFFARDYEPIASVQEIPLVKREEHEFSFFPRPNRVDSQMPRFLDGSVEIDNVDSEATTSLPFDKLQELQSDAEVIMTDQLPSSEDVNEPAGVETTEDMAREERPAPRMDEVSDLPSPRLEQTRDQVHPAEHPQAADEPAIATDHDLISTERLQEPKATPRRQSQRLLSKPGIYSEYFTPRKVSKARGSSPIPEEAVISHDKAVDLPTNDLEAIVSEEVAATEGFKANSLNGNVTTDIGFYVHLNHLAEYYNQVVDVMAICVSDSTAPERAKSGPKDFHTSLQLDNASNYSGQNAHITAQIFRPRKNVLPHTRRGDVIVLRGFLVQSMMHRPMLLSTDASAWAVFPSEDELRHDSKMPTIVSGPPIELGPGEENLASSLFLWWKAEGAAQNLESSKRTNMNQDQPSQQKSARHTRKSRSELPAPFDLRRSPRKVRHEQSQTSTGQDRSPSFQPLSPTFAQQSLQSAMAPPLHPSTSQSRAGTFSKAHASPSLNKESDESEPQDAPTSKTPVFVRRHTRSISRASLDAAEASPLDTVSVSVISPITERPLPADDTNPQMSTPLTTPFHHNLSGSVSENNSVSGETNSSRRRRHERRSTSLIHELRDGTQWVDVEDSEIVSVSASDEDGDEDGDRMLEDIEEEREPRNARDMEAEAEAHAEAETGAEADQGNAEEMDEGETIEASGVEHSEIPSTPTRRGRGRPRKDETQRSPPSTRSNRHTRILSHGSVSVDEGDVNTSPTVATEANMQRMTRSRGKAQIVDKGDNVHELRDGAKYTD